MFGYLDFLFLSYRGRIGRLTYWVASTVLTIAQLCVIFALLRLANIDMAALEHASKAQIGDTMLWRIVIPIFIVSALFLYPAYAVATKRWHDRNKSGWWWAISLVPIIGGLWYLIELGFLGGSDYENDYGPPPG